MAQKTPDFTWFLAVRPPTGQRNITFIYRTLWRAGKTAMATTRVQAYPFRSPKSAASYCHDLFRRMCCGRDLSPHKAESLAEPQHLQICSEPVFTPNGRVGHGRFLPSGKKPMRITECEEPGVQPQSRS